MLRWLLSLLRRRRDHTPRAEKLVLALPPAPMTIREAIVYGAADFSTGNCTRCGRYWLSYCRTGDCGPVHVLDRPVAMPLAGPGTPRRG